MKRTSSERICDKALIENYVFILSLICSFAVTAAALMLISMIPVDTDVTKYTDLVLPTLLDDCAPEPLEMPMYAAAIILMPASFLGFYSLFIKRKESINGFSLYGALECASVSFLVILSVAATIATYAYFYDFFTTKWYHYLICFCLALGFCFLFSKSELLKNKKAKKWLYVLGWAIIIVYTFYKISSINYMMQDTHHVQLHYYAWWYPVYKVYSGNTIGVDFNNIYGFYPYIVVPALKLLGGVNQSSVSVLYALLICFVATSYFVFCYRFINNKLLAFITAFAASVYGPLAVLGDSASGSSIYFQYQPTRTLFIAVCLLAVSVYTAVKNKKIKTAIKLIMIPVLGIGLMWNLEMGIVSLVIWAGFFIFESAVKNTLFDKKTGLEVLKAVFSSVASILVFIAIVELITYMRAGCFIGKEDFLFGMICFEGTGFFMIAIAPGTWIPIWIPFMAGVIVAIPYLIGKKPTVQISESRLTGLFIIAISGLGAFIYFMGRSAPINDFSYLPYSAMSYALLFEYYYSRIGKYKTEKDKVPGLKTVIAFDSFKSFICMFMVSLVLVLSFGMVINSAKPEYKTYHSSVNSSDLIINKTAQDIKLWADENNGGEIPNILTYYNAFLNETLGRPSTEDVCDLMDWFFKENAHTYIEFINSHSNESFVINERAIETLMICYPDEWIEILGKYELSDKKVEFDNNHRYSNIYFYKPISN